MSENQEITTEIASGDHHSYAGFWMRFWAYLADLLIVFSLNGILLSPFKFIGGGEMDVGFWTVIGIAGAIVFYLYFLLMTKYYGKHWAK